MRRTWNYVCGETPGWDWLTGWDRFVRQTRSFKGRGRKVLVWSYKCH